MLNESMYLSTRSSLSEQPNQANAATPEIQTAVPPSGILTSLGSLAGSVYNLCKNAVTAPFWCTAQRLENQFHIKIPDPADLAFMGFAGMQYCLDHGCYKFGILENAENKPKKSKDIIRDSFVLVNSIPYVEMTVVKQQESLPIQDLEEIVYNDTEEDIPSSFDV